jgi:pimeloyl-ACP methyl ester carboxylesterase
MPYTTTDDNVRIYYEEAGKGFPIVFSHEFGDNYETWEPQLQYFARRYRCITYAARGFPPSDVPDDLSAYTQAKASADIGTLMNHLGIQTTYLVGVSMGSYTVLNFALSNPDRVRGLALASCGTGSNPSQHQHFATAIEERARGFDILGAEKMAEKLSEDLVRKAFRAKDPRGWEAFRRRLARHSAAGCSRTLRGVLLGRPSIYTQEEAFHSFTVPTLLIVGDEDEPTVEPSLFIKRHVPNAGLIVFPWSGHNLNIEEPDAFNRALQDFFNAVEQNRWGFDRGATRARSEP